MLEKEYGVEEDGHHRQDELDQVKRVTSEDRLSQCHRIDPYLEETEHTSYKVQKYVG